MKKYVVTQYCQVIKRFEVEAENESQADNIAWDMMVRECSHFDNMNDISDATIVEVESFEDYDDSIDDSEF